MSNKTIEYVLEYKYTANSEWKRDSKYYDDIEELRSNYSYLIGVGRGRIVVRETKERIIGP